MREQRRTFAGGSGRRSGGVRPRVVIFDAGCEPDIEVLQLSECIGIGAHLRHHGTEWTVTEERRASRVLYAKPAVA